MKIAVLVKQVPDTEQDRQFGADGHLDRGGELITDEISERALEAALVYKDADKATEIVVVTMGGEAAEKALKKCLQMGADSGVHVRDAELAGSDAVHTARALAAAVRGLNADLVIAGNESTDGRGGVVPALLSELLGFPLLGSLNAMQVSGSEVTGERRVDAGTMRISAALPAIVTVTEGFGEARFPTFKGIMAAKRKAVTRAGTADLGLDPVQNGARSTVTAVHERPARAAGTKIFDDGTAGAQIAEFLAAGRLI